MRPEASLPEPIEPQISTGQRDARLKREQAYVPLIAQLRGLDPNSIKAEAFSDWALEQAADANYQSLQFTLDEKEKPSPGGRVHVLYTRAKNSFDPEIAKMKKEVRIAKKKKEVASANIREVSGDAYHSAIDEFDRRYSAKPNRDAIFQLEVAEVQLSVEPDLSKHWMLGPKQDREIHVLAQLKMAKRLLDLRASIGTTPKSI